MKSVRKFILVVMAVTISSTLLYLYLISDYVLDDPNSEKYATPIFLNKLVINNNINSNYNIFIGRNYTRNENAIKNIIENATAVSFNNHTFLNEKNIPRKFLINNIPKFHKKQKVNFEKSKLMKKRRKAENCTKYDIDCRLQQTQQPYQYCTLPKNMLNSNSKNNYKAAFFNSLQIKNFNFQNSHSFSKAEIEELKIRRLKKPPACTNTKRNHNYLNNLKIDLDTNNDWTPFINRCQMKIYKGNYDIFGHFSSTGMSFPYLFMHIFKCGGTTVAHTWRNMVAKDLIPKILRFQRWKWYQFQFEVFKKAQKEIEDKFVFSFVRPNILNRFLSSFFEVQKRGMHNDLETYPLKKKLRKMFGMNDLQIFLNALQHRMLCEWNMKLSPRNLSGIEGENEYFIKMEDIYSNEHLPPQMFSLLKENWDFFDLNYVGIMDNIANVLEILFEDHIIGSNLKNNAFMNHSEIHELFGTFYDQKRDRHSRSVISEARLNSLVFEVSDLDAWMIEAICELYWPDFLCLPIDIPKECNLTKMFVDHYGDHIEYNSCYH